MTKCRGPSHIDIPFTWVGYNLNPYYTFYNNRIIYKIITKICHIEYSKYVDYDYEHTVSSQPNLA